MARPKKWRDPVERSCFFERDDEALVKRIATAYGETYADALARLIRYGARALLARAPKPKR